jgi:hypothetical protein
MQKQLIFQLIRFRDEGRWGITDCRSPIADWSKGFDTNYTNWHEFGGNGEGRSERLGMTLAGVFFPANHAKYSKGDFWVVNPTVAVSVFSSGSTR